MSLSRVFPLVITEVADFRMSWNEEKREDSLESSLFGCVLKDAELCLLQTSYCPGVPVLAEAVPADFGMLR